MTTGTAKSKIAAAALIAGLAVFGAAPTAQGAAITWTGAADNFWDNPFNWDGFQVPGQSDDASVNAGTPLSALFGNSANIIGSLNVSGAVHLRNNSYIRLLQASTSAVFGGEIRLFETATIDATNSGSQFIINGNGLLDIRDNARFNNAARIGGSVAGRMVVGSSSTAPNSNLLNISGAGAFNNTGDVIFRNATMNITGSGVFNNLGPVSNFRQENFGGVVNLQDLGRFENNRQYFKSGGTLNIGGDSTFRNASTGTLTEFLHARGDTNISGNGFFDNDASVRLTGGSINLSGAGLMSTSAVYAQSGGALNVQSGGLFVTEASALSANLSGGTFRVHGGGRATNHSTGTGLGGLAVNGANVIVDGGGVLDGTGSFVQNAGTTTINGLMVQTGVTVNGGTLGGTGRIRSNVINTGGTVGPGASPGTLTVEGDFAQGPGGTVAIEIDSLSLFDILAIEGAADLGGTLDLAVGAGYAASAQDGDMFTIIQWESFSGAFTTVNGLNFGDGRFFTLDYGRAGLTLTVGSETVVAASEPGTIALFGLGLVGVGFARRRKQTA